MPHGEDISWPVLREIVQGWAGTTAELSEVTRLTGGCINTTLGLTLADGRRAVLKITPHRVDRAHADEACQLNLLREVGLPVPEVYQWKLGSLDHPFSFILMEYVDGIDLAAARKICPPEAFESLQTQLAELVLKLHERTSAHYMRVTSGEPRRFDAWAPCYRDIFDPIWREVEKSTLLPVKARKLVGKVHERLDRLLAHDDRPRLVHWDIWGTNVMVKPCDDGSWRIAALLDPNCKFAHAEAEIAYMELFHTVTPAFLRAYQRDRKLPADYHRLRKPIYQLYSLLNHLRLFGQEYLKPATSAIDRIAAFV